MAKSTTKGKRGKAGRVHQDFPLWKHPSGRWCKKIKGRAHYFGKVDTDPDGVKALDKYLRDKDELLAGRKPKRPGQDGPTVLDLTESFLDTKWALVQSHELAETSFLDYKQTCAAVLGAIGRNRLLSDVHPEDFSRFRTKLAKRVGPVTLGNEINRIRVVFKFGYDAGMIEHPIRFGPGFKRPSKRVLRLERKKSGPRMLEAEELRAVLAKAKTPMTAAILLGINAGLGAADVARLRTSHVDLESGWLDFPRPKTGIDRRVPLWPETVAAIREALAKRPAPKAKADRGLVFVTKYGQPWVRISPVWKTEDDKVKGGVPLDAVGNEFCKLLKATKLKRPRLGFYALRHTLETIGGETKDQVALDAIMGHARDDMASVYRERISDDRLKAVTDHVRAWLFQKG